MKAYVRMRGTNTMFDPATDSIGVEYRVRFVMGPTGSAVDPDQIRASLNATMERAFNEWCALNGHEALPMPRDYSKVVFA